MAPGRLRRNNRAVAGSLAAMVLLVMLALVWSSSRLPSSYSVMGMGYADFGGGPAVAAHAGHADHGWDGPPRGPGDRDVTELTGPRDRDPDVVVELVARKDRIVVGSDATVDGYTLNGSSPGPQIRARQGDLVEVTLVNRSVPDGVTLHWHGVDVPNAEDGVAGVTQDAVPIGGSHTYRFVSEDAGSYWYHSHQVSHAQVRGGLFGALVVEPRTGAPVDHDVVAAVHTYGGDPTVNGQPGGSRYAAEPGESVRVRVINTDNEVKRVWLDGAPFRVVAVDGHDVNEPPAVTDAAVVVAAGGRVDLAFDVPAGGTAVWIELGGASVTVGPPGARPADAVAPTEVLDLLHYGAPVPPALAVARADRFFEYRIGRRPGLLDGRPGRFWTINGHMFPDVPMFVVSEGDLVRVRIENSDADNHPMHLHGHHAVVLSRDGVEATGSPWVVDSLEVGRGETYEIAFVADNPGIWMDHCHDLPHAADGLVAHLAYAGVYTPFRVGGPAENGPE